MSNQCGFQFNTSYTQLPSAFYTYLYPAPVVSPEMLILNHQLAQESGLDFSELSEQEQANLFAGLQLPPEVKPFAQAYAGHQFGHFNLLGDGRAHVWGEHLTPQGTRFDIQFKGSGPTPYSRRGDGKAALGPMIREYIISEAMHHLGIPTTRSLAVVKTGETIQRETLLPGAILTRLASSHIRVGTFEFAASQNDPLLVGTLLEYVIKRHFPQLENTGNQAINLIKAVIEKQADLITHWMRVGFIHGVMNTDNMTLSGETIDYGPCAFMNEYHPNTVFSSIDRRGRYAYANQPAMAQWNIARLAEALLPFIHQDVNQAIQIAEEVINQFPQIYQRKWLAMMRSKLGLFESAELDDQPLISDLLDWMQTNHADYTNTFCDLSQTEKPKGTLYEQKPFEDWYARWQQRIKKNIKPMKSSLCLMKSVNPVVIPRNHKVEEALKAAHQNNLKPLHDLLNILSKPYKNDNVPITYQQAPAPSEEVYQTFCGT
jgi:uncharacterized protein YdiU (UPF0061 family)